jgi:protein-disulfide isomerase
VAASDDDRVLLRAPLSDRDHAQGAPDAPVTLIEYGDYECPHCGRAYPIVKEVQRRLGRRLRFVFRNFPLKEVHPHAEHAAEAAEAAASQGKYWEMHDTLFEHQSALGDRQLLGYAVTIGLVAEQFAKELASHEHARHVRADFLGGIRSGVNGTPTFFIDGIRLDDPWDVDTLVGALKAAVSTAEEIDDSRTRKLEK